MMKEATPPKINVSMPNNVLLDLFTRFPAKSLLRFKCLSKFCCSIISDPYFCDSHLTQFQTGHDNKNLLISFTDLFHRDIYFFSVNQNGEDPVHVLTMPLIQDNHLQIQNAEMINGLSYLPLNDKCTCLINFCTRETIDLPAITRSVVDDGSGGEILLPHYSFGFDPSNKEYKVLSRYIKKNRQRETGVVMEIRVFTLGTLSWTKIAALHSVIDYSKGSVCVNGAIHSIALPLGSTKLVIEVFDIGVEKFRVIHLPEFSWQATPDLLQVGGCLAIVTQFEYYVLKLWILQDYHNEVWISHDIKFNIQGRSLYYFTFSANNTGEILLIPKTFSTSSLVVYCYAWKTSTWRKINVSELPVSAITKGLPQGDIQCEFISITNYVENILPLSIIDPEEFISWEL